MKKLISLMLFVAVASTVEARSISHVEKDGVWYRFYDETGKKYNSQSSAVLGELKGWSANLVIFQNGAFFYVYDPDLKKLLTCAVATYGDVIAVSGDTFTTQRDDWIYTYDKNGKKLNSRPK